MHVIVLHKMVQNLCYIPVEGVRGEFEYVWAGYVPLAPFLTIIFSVAD